MKPLPLMRLRDVNDRPVQAGTDYVLYWMIGVRRPHSNFALQRALDWSRTLEKPLLVFEPLRVDYPWASVRLHRFILDGMEDNAQVFEARGVTYYAYVEPGPDHAHGLLQALAEHACLIVTDEVPAFFQPRMVAAAGRLVSCMLECVDSWGLLPMRGTGVPYTTAYQFRRFLQRELRGHLNAPPVADPLASYAQGKATVPPEVRSQWPAASGDLLHDVRVLAELPVDDAVMPVEKRGGYKSARRRLRAFLDHGIDAYHERGNDLREQASSGLSPYLHFGHIGTHEILNAIALHEDWSLDDVADTVAGHKEGWWHMRPGAEAFLDELVTWRELSANSALYLPDFDAYSSLPDWARATLKEHTRDRRPFTYTLEEFTNAVTHDPLWNATQRQLLRDGRIHRYLRMLWGKMILEWSERPEQALDIMVELNNRYALDGRDASSWSGIMWVLGRYDHPWPERPIYGSVRSMTSRSTSQKLDVAEYLDRYGE